MRLAPVPGTDDQDSLTFVVDGDKFPVANADIGAVDVSWPRDSLSWSDGDTVNFQLVDEDVAPLDRASLVALYNATDGANWTNSANWNTDAALDTWYGVTTDSDDRVTSLALGSNSLTGSLPAELGDLDMLTELNLHHNQLSGTIPATLGKIAELTRLALSYNQLNGAIPTELGNLSTLTDLGNL